MNRIAILILLAITSARAAGPGTQGSSVAADPTAPVEAEARHTIATFIPRKEAGLFWMFLHLDGKEVAKISARWGGKQYVYALESGTPPLIPAIEYYKSGEVKTIFSVCDLPEEWLIFTVREYWKDGSLKAVFPPHTKDCVMSGVAKGYYRDGVPSWSMRIQDNRYEGPQQEFCPSGNLRESMEYSADVLHGDAKKFRKDGTLKEHCRYRNGKKEGPCYFFRKDGKRIRMIRKYREGELVSESKF